MAPKRERKAVAGEERMNQIGEPIGTLIYSRLPSMHQEHTFHINKLRQLN